MFASNSKSNVSISTHTPLARRDFRVDFDLTPEQAFLLTRLSQGVTPPPQSPVHRLWKFLLTRLSQGVTKRGNNAEVRRDISTHTPLARRDLRPGLTSNKIPISTHTPLARRDLQLIMTILSHMHFYSHASRKA